MPADLDAILLARIQFAFTVSFHILLPAFTIGLASYLAVLEGLWLWRGRNVYMELFRYWLKIFAVVFALGVVSGLVLSYQFGTNWSVFADRTGPVLGPLMSYEVLTAFFLEAGFLGVMLFGMERVGKVPHFFATLMVAGGTLMSAFWILAANSWMHTPAGFVINADGQFVPADWIAVIFNPSFPYRFVHMVLASYLTTAFVVGGVGAYHLIRDRYSPAARTMFSMAMWMATLVAPLQLVAGDLHGLNTLAHQPAKIAAMEGHFETRQGAPLLLFGWPDEEAATTRHAIGIPKLGSLVLTHQWEGEVPGLDQFPRQDWPPAAILFWSFRLMVGIGVLMILTGLVSLVLRWRGQLFDRIWFLRGAQAMAASGFIAVLAGWVTTEVGRQPFTVYGHLRTADSVSPIAWEGVAGSLAAFVGVYLLVFGTGLLFLIRLMQQPPGTFDPGPDRHQPIRTAGLSQAAARRRAGLPTNPGGRQ